MEIINTYDKLQSWIKTATPGERVVYYEGYLAKDLQSNNNNIKQRARAIQELTYHNKDKRNITLTQKKEGDFNYQYIAIKT
jgi:hypothetical protein